MAIDAGPETVLDGWWTTAPVDDMYAAGPQAVAPDTDAESQPPQEKRHRRLLLAAVLIVVTAAVVGLVLAIGPVMNALGGFGCGSVAAPQ